MGHGCGGGGAWVGTKGRCVAASGVGDQIDRAKRGFFCARRKTHRKTFPAVVGGGRRWPDFMRERREIKVKQIHLSEPPVLLESNISYQVDSDESINLLFKELLCHNDVDQQIAATPRAVDIAGAPSSTFIDHDAPSTSSSSTSQQQKSSIISQGVEEPIPNAPFDNPCHEPLHEISTSQESSSNGKSSHPPLEMIYKWTKDHPLENMIGNPS
ncbi:hypothetical protein Tco_0253071 [Tanacetum coccineum]